MGMRIIWKAKTFILENLLNIPKSLLGLGLFCNYCIGDVLIKSSSTSTMCLGNTTSVRKVHMEIVDEAVVGTEFCRCTVEEID